MARALRLTPREAEVARCVLDNLDIDDIATRCAMSPRTVRAHLEHAYKKLGLRNRSDLILLVFADSLERIGRDTASIGVLADGAHANGENAKLKGCASGS